MVLIKLEVRPDPQNTDHCDDHCKWARHEPMGGGFSCRLWGNWLSKRNGDPLIRAAACKQAEIADATTGA